MLKDTKEISAILKQKKLVLISNASVVFVSSLFVMPWLLAPSTKYFDIIKNTLFPLGTSAANDIHSGIAQQKVNAISSFFSTADLFWGSSWPDFPKIDTFM